MQHLRTQSRILARSNVDGYLNREARRLDVFDYIETIYNPKRKRPNNGWLSLVGFRNRHQKRTVAGSGETAGISSIALKWKKIMD